jgi:hypothetical protein
VSSKPKPFLVVVFVVLTINSSMGSILAASAKVKSDENKHHSCDLKENVTNDW